QVTGGGEEQVAGARTQLTGGKQQVLRGKSGSEGCEQSAGSTPKAMGMVCRLLQPSVFNALHDKALQLLCSLEETDCSLSLCTHNPCSDSAQCLGQTLELGGGFAPMDERNVKNKREMIAGEFNKLHTLLREEEQLLLQSLEEEERETLQRLRENVTKLSQQSSSLQQLITEIEEKCQQPVVELLKDVKSTLSRSENVKLQEPEAVSTGLKNVYKISLDMREALKKFGVDVTLDPNTANPELVLSEDRKRVRLGDARQDLPDNPERFDYAPCVLGAEGFAGGRRYWEVEVGDKTEWTLGVCRESVSRKGWVTLSPEDGYWVVWQGDGEYKALTSPWTSLPVSIRPSRVGIFLDYEAGEVSFYNVTDRSHLFTFTGTFSGTLRPYFYPGRNTGGTNAAPLIICPVPDQAGGNLCP
ncbi:E3 ubiquitin-protein ligase TRIM39-like, partial [Terrapene carolina triunguis]|uniref:E3 ubiquitin-protein ligase TRIM39-like n=1 Tax=Terrapene triunguis TaxID=2587831 RepID=UPI0011565F44